MTIDDFDWRNFVITRIKAFKDRRVEDLNRGELEALTAWMERVASTWATVDDQIKWHYIALRFARDAVGIQRVSSSVTETPQQSHLPEPGNVTVQSFGILPAPLGKPKAIEVELSRIGESLSQQLASASVSEPIPVLASSSSVPEDQDSEETFQSYEESQLPEVFRLQTREEVIWQLQRVGPERAQDAVLEILEVAHAALKEATSLDQAKRLSDIAEVLRACAKQLDMGKTVQDDAAAFTIRAEHHYNEVLQEARKRGEIAFGTRGQLKGRKPTGEPNIIAPTGSGVPEGNPRKSSGVPQVPPEKAAPTLAEIGIDKPKAKRLHRWTGISTQELERRIKEKLDQGNLTKVAVLSDSGAPKKEPKPYRALLSFLKDLEKHPENYDPQILGSDSELAIAYGQVRGRFLSLVQTLEPH
jgi:hypothetical protein